MAGYNSKGVWTFSSKEKKLMQMIDLFYSILVILLFITLVFNYMVWGVVSVYISIIGVFVLYQPIRYLYEVYYPEQESFGSYLDWKYKHNKKVIKKIREQESKVLGFNIK